MKKNIKPPKEFVDLAKFFSENYEKLEAGDYFSKKGNYQIKYQKRFRDRFNRSESSISKVSTCSGIIYINKKEIKKTGVTKNFLFFLVIWQYYAFLFASKKGYFYIDNLSVKFYLEQKRPKRELFLFFINLISIKKNNFALERIKNIYKIIKKTK